MARSVLRPSTWLFVGLSLILVAIKLLFDHYPGDFPIRQQAQAFTWLLVGGMILLGALGLFADRSARLPDPLADMRLERQGWLWSAVTGALYGLVTIASFVLKPTHSVLNTAGGWDHVLLPWSVPFYAFGAIFLEFMLRLGALCIGFWLLHVLILRRHLRLAGFWLLSAIVSLYEIWPWISGDVQAHHWAKVATGLLGPLYLSNLLECGLLYRYGWFAPIVFRLSFYLFWHILFGGLAASWYGA